MHGVRGIHLVSLITILALLEYSILGLMVGRARGTYNVKAPATTGDPIFERYFRVHQNTLEALIVFIPALWICGLTLSMRGAALLGLIFLIGRVVYARGYFQDPEKRGPGAMMTALANTLLVLGGLIGVLFRW
jgi:glutathione S-transferase